MPHASIDFPDNEAQLLLIDGKKEGLFTNLDEECNLPKGSDLGYVDKLHALFAMKKPKDCECYDKLKRQKGGVVGARAGCSPSWRLRRRRAGRAPC